MGAEDGEGDNTVTSDAGTPRSDSLRRSFITTSLSGLALPLAAAVTGPLLARALGPNGRGAMAATLAPLVLASVIATVAMPDAVTYFVARNRAAATAVTFRALQLTMASGGIGFLILACSVNLLLRNFPSEHRLFVYACATLPLALWVAVLRSCAQGLGNYRLVNAERWFSAFGRLIILGVFFYLGLLDVASAVWITWLAIIGSGVFYMPLVIRLTAMIGKTAAPRELIPYGIKIWFGTVGALLVLRVDQVLISVMLGARPVGLYAVAVALAEIPQMAVIAVRELVLARLASGSGPHVLAKISRVVAVFAAISAVCGSIAAPLVLPTLFGNSFKDAVPLSQVLFTAMVPFAISIILGVGLAAINHPEGQTYATWLSCAAMLATLPPLVLYTGVMGAAVASLLSYTVGAVASARMYTRHTGLDVRQLVFPSKQDIVTLFHTWRRR